MFILRKAFYLVLFIVNPSMSVSIRNLRGVPTASIVTCLNKAFSDYAIPMSMPETYWKERWEMAKIDYSLSYGLFEGSDLVGFILHGIDHWNGQHCFYNMATGIVPLHRGKSNLGKMYQEALPQLRNRSLKQGHLEVLCDNKKAIRAYEKLGFQIVDTLKSYQLPLDLAPRAPFKLKPNPDWYPGKYDRFKHHRLSFEHRDSIIKSRKGAFQYIEMFADNTLLAYAIVKSSNQNIVQFGFENGDIEQLGLPLMGLLNKHFKLPRIINISTKDERIMAFCEKQAFPEFISQYAMCMEM